MAISTVQIANFALSKIGTDATIEDLAEDSAEANECNLWLEHTRLQCLAAYDWSFARKTATLAAHGDDPTTLWTYRYVYPADAVKARFIENPAGKSADPVPFVIEQSTDGTKSIMTDTADAKLIYTVLVTAPNLYSTFFIELLATVLASHIAFALTGKTKLAQLLTAEAIRMFTVAPAFDAQEKQDGPQREGSAVRGRV